jgi:hypothetical protein
MLYASFRCTRQGEAVTVDGWPLAIFIEIRYRVSRKDPMSGVIIAIIAVEHILEPCSGATTVAFTIRPHIKPNGSTLMTG